MTEYKACIVGLEAALDMNIKVLEVYVDPILIISQSTKEWAYKAQNGQIQRFIQVLDAFCSIPFNYLPRCKN